MKNLYLLLVLFFFSGCIVEKAQKVEIGDVVVINYIGKLDTGEVFDTSYEKIAEDSKIPKAGSFKLKERYGPISFKVGGGTMIPAFETAVLGMEVGESKEVTIQPKDAYGEWSQNLIRTVPRIAVLPKINEIPLEEFKKNYGEPKVNEYVQLKYWKARIIEVTKNSIVIYNEPASGATVQTAYGPAKVMVNETHIITELIPKMNSTVNTPFGEARIIAANKTWISLDHNHPLAGKTLIFEINVEKIEKPKR